MDDPDSLGRLFVGQPDGTYVDDPAFRALGIRGWGHTIVAGDYDNDGDVDLFLVEYTHNDPREQFYLLLNDGTGVFSHASAPSHVMMTLLLQSTTEWPSPEHVFTQPTGASTVEVDAADVKPY